MAYRPKFQSQLGRGPCPNDGKTDCNVRATQEAMDWATNGNWVPGIRSIRTRMGRPCDEPTNLYNGRDAFNSMGIPASLRINQPFGKALTALKNGKPVIASTKYSVLNNHLPHKSGDPNFGGGHGIMLLGTRFRGDGKRVILSWDSLYDGRRKSIPKGPQWVLASVVKRMMVVFARKWGGGNGTNEAWFTIVGKKQNAARLRQYDVGGAYDPQDETELELHEVETQRNDLIAFNADVDFFDVIIEDESLPLELRLEAEFQRSLTRETIPLPDIDPTLDPEQGVDLPDQDDLPDDDEEELAASIDYDEDEAEEE